MDLALLKTLDAQHCAGMTPAEAAAHLSAPTVLSTRPTMVTERGLYARLGPAVAEPMLQALEAAGAADQVVRRALKWLAPPSDGIDLGDAYTRGMLDQLVVAGVLTAEQVAALKGLADSTVSLAQAAGIHERVRVAYIEQARAR